MVFFDVSQDWTILAPLSVPAARRGAEELSHYIDLLRRKAVAGGGNPPAIQDAAAGAPDDSVPLIILNPGEGGPWRNGFTWRLGKGRLELYGDSGRGLWNGIFDFLGAAGLRWPEPGREELPPPAAGGLYPLRDSSARQTPAPSAADLPRLIVGKKENPKNREALARWAARNKIDSLVFSLQDRRLKQRGPRQGVPEALEHYALIPEAGGRELSLLVPRHLFLFHRDLFRMESGRRVRDFNFCPTNPETISLLKKTGAAIFGPLLRRRPEIRTIHLWPGQGGESRWCSCPACRAFSAADQYRIAVNAAADLLAEPEITISLYETPDGGDEEQNSIPPRPNVFILKRLPDGA
jgi:hypothetical protein